MIYFHSKISSNSNTLSIGIVQNFFQHWLANYSQKSGQWRAIQSICGKTPVLSWKFILFRIVVFSPFSNLYHNVPSVAIQFGEGSSGTISDNAFWITSLPDLHVNRFHLQIQIHQVLQEKNHHLLCFHLKPHLRHLNNYPEYLP